MIALRANRPRAASVRVGCPTGLAGEERPVGTSAPRTCAAARRATPDAYALVEQAHGHGVGALEVPERLPAAPLRCPYIAASTATLATGRSTPSFAATGA